jgi:hypothetical protein
MNSQSAERLRRPTLKTAFGWPFSKVWVQARDSLFAYRLTLYICVLLAASVGAYGYWVRTHTIFACQASGYSAERYLAYCNGANYAEYEHGAFYFNLEPFVQDSVRNADVLFLGNSRLQVAFSTVPTAQWFSTNSARYYLLGFSYFENALFEGKLLSRIHHPRAKVYIINLDDFFDNSETIPVHMILHDPKARDKYESKRFWQNIHERVCGTFVALCGHQFSTFRSRVTGAYQWEGASGKMVPVSYDPVVDQNAAGNRIAVAIDFLSRFTEGKCVILTIVPYVGTKIRTAEAIARGVGLKLVTPGIVQGLHTFDGTHLDQPSARRWSQAFFQVAGPKIRSCLANRDAAGREGANADSGFAAIR